MDVRQMRLDAGLSQRRIAELTGIAQPNISAYENGRLAPSATTVKRIVDATRARPSTLLARYRHEIVAVAAKHHAGNIRVFGSVADGSDATTSDLDLIVHFSDQASLYDQVDLIEELERLLKIHVDVISDAAVGLDVPTSTATSTIASCGALWTGIFPRTWQP